MPKSLTDILGENAKFFSSVVACDLNAPDIAIMDLSINNQRLLARGDSAEEHERFVQDELKLHNASIGLGGYGERRPFYQKRSLFVANGEPRCIHLGIDVWLKPGTPLYCPFEGSIHSFQDNATFGDYGPTIILEHKLGGVTFYTLYGHLTRESLLGKKDGQEIAAGENFCSVGEYAVNGNWPAHLHFQVMQDMRGLRGDFPGVATLKDAAELLANCPDPNLILQCKKLFELERDKLQSNGFAGN